MLPFLMDENWYQNHWYGQPATPDGGARSRQASRGSLFAFSSWPAAPSSRASSIDGNATGVRHAGSLME